MYRTFVAPDYQNSSASRKDMSFHGLPLNSKSLLSIWIMKMKRDPWYFNINHPTKICRVHVHFIADDSLFTKAKQLLFSCGEGPTSKVELKQKLKRRWHRYSIWGRVCNMLVLTRTGKESISRKTQKNHMRVTSVVNKMTISEFPVYIDCLYPTYFPNVQPQRKKTNNWFKV